MASWFRSTQLTGPHPIQVRVDGWTSNTVLLERHGWRFHLEEEPWHHHRLIRLAMRHSRYGNAYAIAFQDTDLEHVIEQGIYLRGDPFTHATDTRARGWIQLYMETSLEAQCRDELVPWKALFAVEGEYSDEKDEKRIIVEQQSVQELLDLIVRKQAPQQAEIRQRQRLRERRAASIITLSE